MDVAAQDQAVVRHTVVVTVPDLSEDSRVSHFAVTSEALRWHETNHVTAVTFTHTALRVTTEVEPHAFVLDPTELWKMQLQVLVRYRLHLLVLTLTVHVVDVSSDLTATATTKGMDVAALTSMGHECPTVVVGEVFNETELGNHLLYLRHVTPPWWRSGSAWRPQRHDRWC